MNDFLPLPAAMVQRALDFKGEPVTARIAATVALLRDTPTGMQVYVMRRRAAMVFGGVYAFPGGSVDPSDTDPSDTDPSDTDPSETDPSGGWGPRLELPPTAAHAVVRAAVREVFEETGVRLAEHGDLVRDDVLAPWSRWITPEFEPRRFDTYFFAAALPEGQEPRDISGEADRTLWITPTQALSGYADGTLIMLPPTAATLRDLAAYPRVVDVLAASAGRDVSRPIEPRVEVRPDGTAGLRVS